MISASDLKAGMTFVQDGKLIKVIDASHHKPGKRKYCDAYEAKRCSYWCYL